MKKPAQHLIAEVPRRHARSELTIGIDLREAPDASAANVAARQAGFKRLVELMGAAK